MYSDSVSDTPSFLDRVYGLYFHDNVHNSNAKLPVFVSGEHPFKVKMTSYKRIQITENNKY